jgi:porin
MIGSRGLGSALVALLGLAAPIGGAAWAADVPSTAAAAVQAPAPAEMDVGCEDSVAPALGRLGDPTGLRQALAKKGVALCVTYTGEVMGNVSGGLRRGALYEDKFEFALDIDLDKLAGWPGASFHVSGLQIDGNGLSGHNLGNLLTVSNIEAPVSSRLFELWFQQALFNDRFELRVGQLAAD